MTPVDLTVSQSLLLLVAGAKGAVGSTLAAAVAALQQKPETILPSLTTADTFPYLGPANAFYMAGWDTQPGTLLDEIKAHGILTQHLWQPHASQIEQIPVRKAPTGKKLKDQVAHLKADIQSFQALYPQARPVFVNLMPANIQKDFSAYRSLSRMVSEIDPVTCPDLAYLLAAILSGVPVVNFTPNHLEPPALLEETLKRNIPVSGRDGKTGQTYLKMVLASALKTRKFFVDGWYSLNILGNNDGKNLMDPARAAGKMANKTEVLDEILGYSVGEKYGAPSHKVHIDYYPPRGDAKEAWDVIDFTGLFGLPMSIRLNLLARDSILAAPLVLDLARWMAALHMAGFAGPVPELAFFYKKPVGAPAPLTFQKQVDALERLKLKCDQCVLKGQPA